LASACLFLINNYDSPEIINIGVGEDISIKELAIIIKKVVGFSGDIVFDQIKPDGAPQKLLDVSKLHSLGWKHITQLEDGIRKTYEWYKSFSG